MDLPEVELNEKTLRELARGAALVENRGVNEEQATWAWRHGYMRSRILQGWIATGKVIEQNVIRSKATALWVGDQMFEMPHTDTFPSVQLIARLTLAIQFGDKSDGR